MLINDIEINDLKGHNIEIIIILIVLENNYGNYNYIKMQTNVDK